MGEQDISKNLTGLG